MAVMAVENCLAVLEAVDPEVLGAR